MKKTGKCFKVYIENKFCIQLLFVVLNAFIFNQTIAVSFENIFA